MMFSMDNNKNTTSLLCFFGVFHNEELAEQVKEEEEQLKQDKFVVEGLILSVTQPFEKLEMGKREVRERFSDIGVAKV